MFDFSPKSVLVANSDGWILQSICVTDLKVHDRLVPQISGDSVLHLYREEYDGSNHNQNPKEFWKEKYSRKVD